MTRNVVLAAVILASLALSLPACKPDDKGKTGQTNATTSATTNATTAATNNATTGTNAGTTAGTAGGTAAGAGEDIVPAAEGGKWVKVRAYGVKIRVPEDWTVKLDKDGSTITDSDESTTIVIVGSKSAGMVQKALNDVQKRVSIKDMKLEKSDATTLNGMPGQEIRGTAAVTKKDGTDQEIQFIAYNVQTGAESAATLMLFSEAEMYEAKREIIEGLVKTIAKLDK